MTASDLSAYLHAGRDFMRRTRDPKFRSHLKSIGWTSGQVVIAFDADAIASLVSRLAFNEVGSPCLIAIAPTDEHPDYRLMFMEAVKPRRLRRHPSTPVSPQATVGMLYSSLTGCGAYVPSDWVGDMTFSRAPESA